MKNAVQSIVQIFQQFNYILTKKQKEKSVIIFFAILFGAFFETLGVSIIIPFVQAMVSPNQLLQNRYIASIANLFNITDAYQIIVLFSIAVIIIYIIKNIYLIGLSYIRVKYSCSIQKELSVKMLKIYLKRDYVFFSEVNSSELLRSVGVDVNRVYNIMSQLFKIMAELLTAAMICIVIMITDPIMAIGIIGLAGVCLVSVTMGFRERMKKMGKLRLKYDAEVTKHSYQAFQGIKEVLVMQRQEFFANHYEEAYINQQKATVNETVANESPPYIIEAVCVSGLIAMVCMKIVTGANADELLPQLATFAVGAFRILPSVARITSSFNIIIFNRPGFDVLYENMHKVSAYGVGKAIEENSIREHIHFRAENKKFEKQLVLKGIHWKYPRADREVLSNLNMTIEKGTSVGLIGPSGAGKTTLADIILGLLMPNQGHIYMDGIDISKIQKEWGSIIGYVPQSVFLIDDSIRNNVAFGIEPSEIKDENIWSALKQAQLRDFVEGLPNGLNTEVGERGVRFSGGQRQRIAIARALYMNPDILVLDEATSALDNGTENAVMEAIEALQGQKTLIIVAHRLSTIQKCDCVYEISDGKVVQT